MRNAQDKFKTLMDELADRIGAKSTGLQNGKIENGTIETVSYDTGNETIVASYNFISKDGLAMASSKVNRGKQFTESSIGMCGLVEGIVKTLDKAKKQSSPYKPQIDTLDCTDKEKQDIMDAMDSTVILKNGSQVFYAGREKYTVRLIGGKDNAAMIEVVRAKNYIPKMIGIVALQGGRH